MRRTGRTIRRWCLGGGGGLWLMVLCAAAGAQGQEARVRPDGMPPVRIPRLLPEEGEPGEVQVDESLRRIVEDLDAEDYEDRERGSEALARAAPTLAELCGVLGEVGLSAEQRYRLLIVLREQITGAPRGALGVSMSRVVTRAERGAGVEVIDLVAGLPAEKVLQIGDRITHVDGRPLASRNELVVLIQSKQPGDEMTLTVRRSARDANGDLVIGEDGKVVVESREVTIALGSIDRLLDPSTGQPPAAGTVERELARQADEAQRRFGPRPKRIALPVMGSGRPVIAPRLPESSGD